MTPTSRCAIHVTLLPSKDCSSLTALQYILFPFLPRLCLLRLVYFRLLLLKRLLSDRYLLRSLLRIVRPEQFHGPAFVYPVVSHSLHFHPSHIHSRWGGRYLYVPVSSSVVTVQHVCLCTCTCLEFSFQDESLCRPLMFKFFPCFL